MGTGGMDTEIDWTVLTTLNGRGGWIIPHKYAHDESLQYTTKYRPCCQTVGRRETLARYVQSHSRGNTTVLSGKSEPTGSVVCRPTFTCPLLQYGGMKDVLRRDIYVYNGFVKNRLVDC